MFQRKRLFVLYQELNFWLYHKTINTWCIWNF